MRRFILYVLAGSLFFSLISRDAGSAEINNAASSKDKIQAILRETYLASGGRAWKALKAASLEGEYEIGGMKGSFEQLIDFHSGRDLLKYHVGVIQGQQENEQNKSWWMDEKGLVMVREAPDALADAATQSFLDKNGWFDFNAEGATLLPDKQLANGATYHSVQITPPGGRVLTLWINTETHRVDHVGYLDGSQREITLSYSDYRNIHGIWYPFTQRQSSGDPSSDVIAHVREFKAHAELPNKDFEPPASKIHDIHFLNGVSSTTVPFSLQGGHIVVNVSMQGGEPLPFILDSGGLNLLSLEAAKKLRIKGEGTLSINGVGNNATSYQVAQVTGYSIGNAELRDQQFTILQLPRAIVFRGAQEPIAGLVGYEIFRRFAVHIDYQKKLLTLTSPEQTSTCPAGNRIPLLFNDRTPYVKARVGGAEGYFGIDTGDTGGVTIFQSFYEDNDVAIQVPALRGYQQGVGGKSNSFLTRVSSFSLGNFSIERPLTSVNFARSGVFASKLVNGNLGYLFFRKFKLDFDYERRVMCLEKSSEYDSPMPYNRSGMTLEMDQEGKIVVSLVMKDSPAAHAGVQIGDQILAIQRQPVSTLSYGEVRELLMQPAGSSIAADVQRGADKLHINISLQDLLPVRGTLKHKPSLIQ